MALGWRSRGTVCRDPARWGLGGPGAEGCRAQTPHPVHPPAPLSPIAPLSSSVAPNKLLSAASGGKLGGRGLAEGSFTHSFIHPFIQDAHRAPSRWCQGDAGMKPSPVELSTVSRNVSVAVTAGDAQPARGGWCHQRLMPAGWAEPSSSRGSSSAGPEEGAGVAQQQGRAFRLGEQHVLRKLGAPGIRIPAPRELEGQPGPQRPVTQLLLTTPASTQRVLLEQSSPGASSHVPVFLGSLPEFSPSSAPHELCDVWQVLSLSVPQPPHLQGMGSKNA